MRSTPARPVAFDPYGQSIPAARTLAPPSRTSWRGPILLFWAAALALLAGRLVLPVQPAGTPATSAVTLPAVAPS